MEERIPLHFGDPRQTPHYAALGYFFCWFSAAELSLTFLLARLCDASSGEKFQIAVKGLDARAKCDRIRHAAKRYNPLGPIFAKTMEDFEQRSIRLCNKLTHSLLFPSTDRKGFVLSTMGAVKESFGKADVKTETLANHAEWLNTFAFAINKTIEGPLPDIIEINDLGARPPLD